MVKIGKALAVMQIATNPHLDLILNLTSTFVVNTNLDSPNKRAAGVTAKMTERAKVRRKQREL